MMYISRSESTEMWSEYVFHESVRLHHTLAFAKKIEFILSNEIEEFMMFFV